VEKHRNSFLGGEPRKKGWKSGGEESIKEMDKKKFGIVQLYMFEAGLSEISVSETRVAHRGKGLKQE